MGSYQNRTWWARHSLSHRLQDEAFLEAAVTAAFLVAAADGSASEQEYNTLLDRLELLGGVDRDKIDELLTAAASEVEASGFEGRIARVGELISDRDAAEAALALGLAIAVADDEVSDTEREIAGQLATGMGLVELDLDTLLAELRS
jgi:tellurite resistance protein